MILRDSFARFGWNNWDALIAIRIWWFPKIRGPYSKDYSILGSILGSPYFGKLPFIAVI